jgi:hypothetical protein
MIKNKKTDPAQCKKQHDKEDPVSQNNINISGKEPGSLHNSILIINFTTITGQSQYKH